MIPGIKKVQHRMLLTVKVDDSVSIEDVFVKISEVLSDNKMEVIDILPRCPYEHYPYGQSCCKLECDG
jgi:hypothetical protein